MTAATRRSFLSTSSAAVTLTAAQAASGVPASERVRVGVIGAGGRALSLIKSFAANHSADVVTIADVDRSRFAKAVQAAADLQNTKPRTDSDFRRIIDDPTIDALVIGTPDHWHAIPTILGCLAGKDVYVEKPDAHNIEEGRRMVAAMKKHKRIVQMGSQHRSTHRLQSAMEYAAAGHLGRCLVAKAWESTRQGNIGRPANSEPPAGVDYDMWLGSAPKRPFNRNRFHGRWRWFFDYGTGDLGNDGVHRLDMAVAVMDAAAKASNDPPLGLPQQIHASGGKWYFDDDQEFPDTMQVTYQFASGKATRLLTYEMRLWAPYHYLNQSEGAAVFGDRGYLVIGNSGWQAFESKGRLVAEESGGSHEAPHVQNFLDCIKSRKRPVCDLETVGHPASVLCHAGNIAARIGRSLQLDPMTESFSDDPQANELIGRPEYRKPWALPEV